jgi:hypothetical protein
VLFRDAGPSPVGQLGEPMRESDVDFWARQFSEHALFFSLGIEDPSYRAAARALHTAWERARPSLTVNTILPLCTELRAYKVDLYTQLQSGKWLGWIFPSFVDHTRRELDLFVAHARGIGIRRELDATEWLRFMAEHAAFAAHLMDPEEGARVRQAVAATAQLEQLRMACAHGVTPQLLSLSKRAGEGLDRFVVRGDTGLEGEVRHPPGSRDARPARGAAVSPDGGSTARRPMSHPVGVFVFGQAGCPACSEYIPRFKRIAAAFRDRFPIGIYDLLRDGPKANEFATRLGIRATPTTVVMTSRGSLHKHVGALAESAIRELLERVG